MLDDIGRTVEARCRRDVVQRRGLGQDRRVGGSQELLVHSLQRHAGNGTQCKRCLSEGSCTKVRVMRVMLKALGDGGANNVVPGHSHRQGRGKTRDSVAWGVVWARENGLDEKENKSAAH